MSLHEEIKSDLFRFLHNEGDGGVWENFDRANADEVATALAPLVERLITTQIDIHEATLAIRISKNAETVGDAIRIVRGGV